MPSSPTCSEEWSTDALNPQLFGARFHEKYHCGKALCWSMNLTMPAHHFNLPYTLETQLETTPEPPHSSPSPNDHDLNYGMLYTTTSYQQYSAAPVSHADFNSTWSSSLTPITPIDPTHIEGLEWSGFGVVSQPQINEGRPAVNTGRRTFFNSGPEATWDETHYNNISSATPPFSDTTTSSHPSNNNRHISSARMPASSRPSPPASHHSAASTRPPSPGLVVVPQSTSKKRKKTPAAPKKQPLLKPSKSPAPAAAPLAGISASDALKRCQDQLNDISLCRLKMLEHDGFSQELEMQQLVADVKALKEATARNHRQLETALEMAESLDRGWSR